MFAVEPEVLHVISGWTEKAEHDLLAAVHTLKLGKDCPTDTVCFHAQQCVEKYVKALLVFHEVDFPKTHNLRALLTLLPIRSRPDLTLEEQQMLTRYATVTRYPGDYEVISLTEARNAVKIARRVRRQIRKRLPKEALYSK
jgi:HEPN domain-containing protein